MLDVSIRIGLLNLMADLRDREGVSILYVTHDIASAWYSADVVAVMYAGKFVEQGPPAGYCESPDTRIRSCYCLRCPILGSRWH